MSSINAGYGPNLDHQKYSPRNYDQRDSQQHNKPVKLVTEVFWRSKEIFFLSGGEVQTKLNGESKWRKREAADHCKTLRSKLVYNLSIFHQNWSGSCFTLSSRHFRTHTISEHLILNSFCFCLGLLRYHSQDKANLTYITLLWLFISRYLKPLEKRVQYWIFSTIEYNLLEVNGDLARLVRGKNTRIDLPVFGGND